MLNSVVFMSKQFTDNAVIQYSQLSGLPNPEPHVLAKFNSWLSRPSLGAAYLTGRDRDIWAQGVDLMMLKQPPQAHVLSRLFTTRIVPVYHSIVDSQLVCTAASWPFLLSHFLNKSIDYLSCPLGWDNIGILVAFSVAGSGHCRCAFCRKPRSAAGLGYSVYYSFLHLLLVCG